MSREARLVLWLAVAVVLLGATALALHRSPPEAIDESLTFKAVAPTDVLRVGITNAHGAYEIAFTGEGYLVGDIPAELVDRQELIALLTACGQVEALRTVADAPADLAPYGLAEPAAQVEIGYADGSALTLLLGQLERVSGDYYLAIAGDPAVYLLAAERAAGLLLPQKALIEDLITPRLALSSPLSALLDVTFAGGLLAEPVTVHAVAAGDPQVARAALSFGAPTHIVRGRGVYELDQTYGVEMLGALLGLTALDVAGYNLTPQEISAFGFDRPTMQVAFDLRNGVGAPVEHYRLALLRQGDTCYLTRNDDGVIYVVAEPAFLRLAYDKLLVRWFLSPLLTDVRAVEISSEGQAYSFAITGETNAAKRVTCNGQPLDIDRFRTLYRLLVSAAHDGALLPDATVTGEPLLRVTYHYRDVGKAPDVMALYPGDARRVVVEVNGVTELAMREMYLTRVQQALRALWTDTPIELDW
jgi:hypothetical protein